MAKQQMKKIMNAKNYIEGMILIRKASLIVILAMSLVFVYGASLSQTVFSNGSENVTLIFNRTKDHQLNLSINKYTFVENFTLNLNAGDMGTFGGRLASDTVNVNNWKITGIASCYGKIYTAYSVGVNKWIGVVNATSYEALETTMLGERWVPAGLGCNDTHLFMLDQSNPAGENIVEFNYTDDLPNPLYSTANYSVGVGICNGDCWDISTNQSHYFISSHAIDGYYTRTKGSGGSAQDTITNVWNSPSLVQPGIEYDLDNNSIYMTFYHNDTYQFLFVLMANSTVIANVSIPTVLNNNDTTITIENNELFIADYNSSDLIRHIYPYYLYPRNITLDIGEKEIRGWNNSGFYSGNDNISINVSLLNNILEDNCNCSGCTNTSTYCSIPLYLSSDTNGFINVTLLNASSAFGLDNCVNSHKISSNATSLVINFSESTDYELSLEYGLNNSYEYNFSTSGTFNNISICVYPEWSKQYSDFIVSYSNQTYQGFEQEMTNQTTFINLQLQAQADTTPVTFTVLDYSTDPVENAYIYILKWDVGQNAYYTTEVIRTDEEGKAVGNIILSTEYYKFMILYEGETKLVEPETQGIKIYTTTRTFRISLEETEWFNDYNTVLGTDHELTWNQSGTNSFVFTWSDSSGTLQEGCLKVLSRNTTTETELLDSCTTSVASSIVYPVTIFNCTTYTATSYFKFEENKYAADVSEYKSECDTQIYKKKGEAGKKEVAFYAFLLIFALTLIGLPYPVLSYVLFSIGLITTVVMGLWDITWQLVIAIIILGLLHVYKASKK